MSDSLKNRTLFDRAIANELDLRAKAMAGDLIWVCTPSAVAPSPTAAAWTRSVVVTLETAAGEIHTWFNKAITSGASIANTSSAGTATIPSTTLTIENGKATIVVSGDAESWLATETDTLTIAQATILGATVGAKTSVETFTA